MPYTSCRNDSGGTWRAALDFSDEREYTNSRYLIIKVRRAISKVAAEFETRANCGLNIGMMELDMTDGEVRCKSSLCSSRIPYRKLRSSSAR